MIDWQLALECWRMMLTGAIIVAPVAVVAGIYIALVSLALEHKKEKEKVRKEIE